jgi:amino acid adenylation domain-containing protein
VVQNTREDASIPRAFEAEVARRPQAIALKYADVELTYEQLNARANHVAAHLSARGVGRGDIVALMMSRSPEQIIAILAILKCGGAYLPLDGNNPVSRNLSCLEAAQVGVLIRDHDIDESLAYGRQVVDSRSADLFSAERVENIELAVDPEDRCYVMFTSGSTAQPKGVVVPHRAVIRLVKNADFIQVSEQDSILQFAPLSFDASTFEIWGVLLNGGTLVLYSGATFDPNLFAKEIRENNVTVLWLTAALFHLIATRFLASLKGVKVLLAGGDVLYPKVINKVLDEMPDVLLINGYGPTENTTFTCCHRITTANRPMECVPIGKAIAGTQIHILNESLQPVPNGEIGELYTSGLGVALGYLNDGEHSGAFFRNPSIAEGLIYRTGDLVRCNANGEIEFKGRRDHQVKIRGFRVSLEEVQASLLKVEHVVDAVVMVEKFDNGDQQLIAYLLLDEEGAITVADAKKALAAELPAYMVPDLIRLSTHLPVNKNGKIDRQRIKEAAI